MVFDRARPRLRKENKTTRETKDLQHVGITCMLLFNNSQPWNAIRLCQQIAINKLCSRYNLYRPVYYREKVFALIPKLAPTTPRKKSSKISGDWNNSERPYYFAECQLKYFKNWSFSPFDMIHQWGRKIWSKIMAKSMKALMKALQEILSYSTFCFTCLNDDPSYGALRKKHKCCRAELIWNAHVNVVFFSRSTSVQVHNGSQKIFILRWNLWFLANFMFHFA